MRNKWWFAILFGLSICVVIFAGLYLKTNAELLQTKIKLNNALEFPTAISQPRVMVEIEYNKEGSKTKHMSAYDDYIDVRNEKLNRELTFAILMHREHELICPQVPIQIKIDEQDRKAKVRIHWAESAQIFTVPLE